MPLFIDTANVDTAQDEARFHQGLDARFVAPHVAIDVATDTGVRTGSSAASIQQLAPSPFNVVGLDCPSDRNEANRRS